MDAPIQPCDYPLLWLCATVPAALRPCVPAALLCGSVPIAASMYVKNFWKHMLPSRWCCACARLPVQGQTSGGGQVPTVWIYNMGRDLGLKELEFEDGRLHACSTWPVHEKAGLMVGKCVASFIDRHCFNGKAM